MLHQKFTLMPTRQDDIFISLIESVGIKEEYIYSKKYVKIRLNDGDLVNFRAFNDTKNCEMDLSKKYPRFKIRIDILDQEFNLVKENLELVKEGAFVFKKNKINLKKFNLGVVLIEYEKIVDRLIMIVV